MSLVEKTFASIAQADVINTVVPWTSASPENKQIALEYGTLYMLDTYAVGLEDEAPCLIQANSMLAQSNLTLNVFLAADQLKTEQGLTKKSVKADVVETSKSYDANLASQWQDPFPTISALMRVNGFNLRKSSGGGTVPLIRR